MLNTFEILVCIYSLTFLYLLLLKPQSYLPLTHFQQVSIAKNPEDSMQMTNAERVNMDDLSEASNSY